MKKRIYLLAFLLLLFPITKVNAYSFALGAVSTGENNNSSKKPEYEERSKTGFKTTDSYLYNCYYKYKVTVGNNININMYDLEGNYVNQSQLIPTNTFLAGTYIGLNIYEQSKVSWEITNLKDSWVYRQGYDCYYSYSDRYCAKRDDEGTCISWAWSRYRDVYMHTKSDVYQCDRNLNKTITIKNGTQKKYYWARATTSEVSDSYYVQECQNIAYKEVQAEVNKKKVASYSIEYYNANYINPESKKGEEKIALKKSGSGGCNNINVKSIGLTASNRNLCTYYYNINKTCIDVKTGKVRYLDNNEKCKSSTEIEVQPPGQAQTAYFIPLDTKSTDEFRLLLDTWQSAQYYNESQCNYVKSNYSDWKNLLVGPNDETLRGISDYNKYIKGKGNNACKIKTSIVFPIVQKFYNEIDEKGSKKFKGFAFYYQPIDIGNPFPNGIATDSFWYTKSNEPSYVEVAKNNISKSYSTLTYKATNINSSQVREYNNTIPYTDWKEMNVSGTSNFISSEGIVTRQSKVLNSYYKLGCGPSNENWEECKR